MRKFKKGFIGFIPRLFSCGDRFWFWPYRNKKSAGFTLIDYILAGSYVAAVGSYGPNGGTNNLYDSDDVLYVLAQ